MKKKSNVIDIKDRLNQKKEPAGLFFANPQDLETGTVTLTTTLSDGTEIDITHDLGSENFHIQLPPIEEGEDVFKKFLDLALYGIEDEEY